MSEDSFASGDGGAAGDVLNDVRRRILEAATPNVVFDGWSEAALSQASRDAGVSAADAKLAFPRGPIDLALFFHRDGDREMTERLQAAELSSMRVRDRIAFAVRTRLDVAGREKEAVRRGAALFALPMHAADGARAIWETADAIWTTLGDPSEDLNWWTKRGVLSGVYSATTLFWLGDESDGHERTWAFLDRRIEGVMRFERMKAQVNANPLGRLMLAGPNWLAQRVRKPGRPVETGAPVDLPGGP